MSDDKSSLDTPRSPIRRAVDGELLDPDNPIDYLVGLLLEGKRYDGAWDGDEEQVARYAIASWCQEIGWAPDLRAYDVGEQVDLGDEVPYLNVAFYDHEHVDEGSAAAQQLAELVDGHERGVVAIIQEGIDQHRGDVYDANDPTTQDDLDAAADLAKAVKDTATEGDDA